MKVNFNNLIVDRGVSKIRTSDLKRIDENLKCAFSTIKEEMEEHLQAINENTVEIQQSFDNTAGLELKVDKLSERVDEIHFMFKQLISQSRVSISLTLEEQRIFLILYTSDSYVSPQQISSKFNIDINEVLDVLDSIFDKGIPLEKQFISGSEFVKLESNFKDIQAKQQVIKIDPSIKSQFQNTVLNHFFEA